MNPLWHGDRWSGLVSKVIEARLRKQRELLAALTGLTDESEINALLEDLATELRRCWAILRDINRAASDARVRSTLQMLLKVEDGLYDGVMAAEPNTRSLIEDYWPGGQRFLEDVGSADEAELRRAIENALKQLPTPDRGRPKGMADYASAELGKALAVIYQKYSSRQPVRRVHPETNKEYGPYRDFVASIVAIFPAPLRRYKSAPSGSVTKTVDHLVRRGVGHFRDLQKGT